MRRAIRFIDALNDRIGRSVMWLALLIALIQFATVIGRYVFAIGFIPVQESIWYLNAVLFMLIGFEIIVIAVSLNVIWLTIAAIPMVLFARFVAVALPLTVLRVRQTFTKGAVPTLVWGGLRGGISVALALSLPDMAQKEAILAVTYGVVVFSIVVQGLTFKSVIRRFVR